MAKKIIKHKKCNTKDCDGEYKFNGNILTSHPAQYCHTCEKCKSNFTSFNLYPDVQIIFKTTETEEIFE